MSCPALETWLEALDAGASEPDGSHGDCDACSSAKAQAAEVLAALAVAAPTSSVAGAAFVDRVVARTRGRARWIVLAAVPLAAAAGILAYVHGRSADVPVARGSLGYQGICEVAEVRGGELRVLADGDRTAESAALAFRVQNSEPDDRWFGIFGVGEDGRIGWYYPAYEEPSDDPETVHLPGGSPAETLGEKVSLPLGPGRVRVFCWQAERIWRVREADAAIEKDVALARDPTALERFDALGGRQESVLLWFGEAR